MLLSPGHFGYTTMIFGGHSAIAPGIHMRPASRPFPQGSRKTCHHWSMCQNVQDHTHSTESQGFNAVGAVRRMLLCWPYPGFYNFSLVCTYSCIGEAAMCVSMSTEIKAPFWGFLFKCSSTVHKKIGDCRLLVSDFKPDFNKPLHLSIMPTPVGLYGT